MIDKFTKLFLSVSSTPGNFGALLYNSAFRELDINAIYRPIKCESLVRFNDLVNNAKTFCVSGISVSMPFKKKLVELRFGEISRAAEEIGNANTLVLDSPEDFLRTGKSIRIFNTDFVGFEKSSQQILGKIKNVIIYGTGAVSDSICYVLNKNGILYKKTKTVAELSSLVGDMLINATPLGMEGYVDDVFSESIISKFNYVFDVVVKKETNLIKVAKNLGIPCVNGVSMSLEQLCLQFSLYTHQDAPRSVFERVLMENGYV